MVYPYSNILALPIILVTLLTSCFTDKVISREIARGPLLEASLSAKEDRIGLAAEEAYFDGTRLFVKYKLEQLDVYAVGTWSGRKKQAAANFAPDTTVGSLILPLEKHSEEPWPKKPEGIPPLVVLSISQWNRYLNKIIGKMIPESEEHGTLLDLYHKEYFLYLDSEGKTTTTLIQNKPAEIRTRKVLTFDEILAIALTVLEEYLENEGIEEGQVIFNTGDTGLHAYPFVFADIERRLILFAKVSPTSTIAEFLFTRQDFQAATHIIGSHLAIMVRPVSTLTRLSYIILDASYDLLESGVDVFTWPVGSVAEAEPLPPLRYRPGMDLEEWERKLDEMTGSESSYGIIRYLIDGKEFFPRFIDALTGAKRSIHIRTYIFDNDDYAVKIADILKRRSRDTDIKVLIDGFGTILATKVHAQSLPLDHEAPGSVRKYLEQDSNVKVRVQTNPWLTLDHSKLAVVDGQVAFLGGMNIGREYRYHRHDIMLEIRGPVVKMLQDEFDEAWAHAGAFGDLAVLAHKMTRTREASHKEGYPIRVLYTRAAEPEIYHSQLEAIRRSQGYIFIENMYFTDDNIIEELIMARRRGVDVRVIIPMEGYLGPFDRSNILAANQMLANGIRVFVYPGRLHAKAAVYDGWACLGSANFDKASFKRNREINVAFSHPGAVDQLLNRLFLPDFEKSLEITDPIPEKWSDLLAEILTDQL
ncbi:MAG: phosphatidylserine/phosphatidylglycerophosphate/cardiolipin synthase family protein [Deltaproteobacteria bacterium]|nr:MAG: phosphatidylserine/phosphatidylglycerophosphate/cardiolipin synthase family protein [Deltaproteobacteria bacterium]